MVEIEIIANEPAKVYFGHLRKYYNNKTTKTRCNPQVHTFFGTKLLENLEINAKNRTNGDLCSKKQSKKIPIVMKSFKTIPMTKRGQKLSFRVGDTKVILRSDNDLKDGKYNRIEFKQEGNRFFILVDTSNWTAEYSRYYSVKDKQSQTKKAFKKFNEEFRTHFRLKTLNLDIANKLKYNLYEVIDQLNYKNKSYKKVTTIERRRVQTGENQAMHVYVKSFLQSSQELLVSYKEHFEENQLELVELLLQYTKKADNFFIDM